MIDLFLQFALLGDQRVHFVGRQLVGKPGADRLEAIEQRLGLGQALDNIAKHVFSFVERWLLRQIADPRPLGGPGFAGKVAFFTGHDAQQGRLSGAVGALTRRFWRPARKDSQMSFNTSRPPG